MSGIQALLVGSGGDRNITLSDVPVTTSGAGLQQAAYQLGNDGGISVGVNGIYSSAGTWCSASGTPSNYEARVTVVSGSTPEGAPVGSWEALSSTLSWDVADNVVDGSGVSTAITVEIRRAGGTLTLDSCTVTLEATRTS